MTIAIIGGGAAGLMTAATILEANNNANILLFDKNPGLGAKVIISGGGRCNVTTSITSIKELKTKYIRGAEFLDHALKSFTPRSIYKRFEEHEVPLKIENDGRVFPISDNGKDIVRIFEKMFVKNNLNVHLKEGVEGISKTKTKTNQDVFEITTAKGIYQADIVVLTTGGNAYSYTGSTGDGYSFAKKLGHSVTPLGPSLNSFLTLETRPHSLSGTVFQNGGWKIVGNSYIGSTNLPPTPSLTRGGVVHGPILCTHFGFSGPATFAMSAQISYEIVSKEQSYQVFLIPDTTLSYEQWNEIFLWKEKGKAPLLANVLAQYFTRKTADCFVALADISLQTHLHDLKTDDRKKLCHLLADGIPVNLIQRRPGDEFVTAGGVNTNEVNPKTMESKITPGLYFAGEILNIDGLTGGFNLTASWATGRLAGQSIVKQFINDR